MSIFSSLRYPISVPPTAAQLEALPHDVYNQWLDEVGILTHNNYSPDLMAYVLNRLSEEDARVFVERLQCIIYGLDE